MTKQEALAELREALDEMAARPLLINSVKPLCDRIYTLCDILDEYERIERGRL